jgi:hypothetical protein
MCALRLAQKIKPSGRLLQPGCQAAPPPLGVRGVAVAVAEQAYPAGEVVEVPAQSVEGNDGGVELAAGRLMVAVGVLAASGGDQGYVAFWRARAAVSQSIRTRRPPTDMRLAGCGSPWVMTESARAATVASARRSKPVASCARSAARGTKSRRTAGDDARPGHLGSVG